MTPNSYKDPFWVGLAEQTEREVGLPSGLLRNILLRGERSNADQVSSAGAKTPFQVIPETRQALLSKYGVDAYAGPEQAAKAAGLLLKENLERNQGDVTQAIGEYIGGTDRKNWGPITKDYIQRVSSGMEQTGLIDEFKQWQAAQGGNTPQPQAQPMGEDLLSEFKRWQAGQQAKTLGDQPTKAQDLEQSDSGIFSKIGRQVGLTARYGAEGLAGLAGIVTDPIAAMVNQALPEGKRLTTLQDATSRALTDLGLPSPETAMERNIGSATRALAGGGASVGTGLLMRSGGKLAQEAGTVLAANPAQQLTGSAGAGAAQQVAAEQGAGSGMQAVAAIGGALAGDRAAATRGARAAIKVPLDAARRENIPVMTSDVIKPTTFIGKSAQNIGERIPVFGTGASRATQEEARKQAVTRLAQDYGADQSTRFDEAITSDLLRKRGDELQRYTQLKGDVFERLGQASPVPLNRTLTQLDSEISRLEGIESIPRATIQDLKSLRNDFASSKGIGDVEFLRKLLGDKLSDPSLANVKTAVDKIPGRVYKELKQDMGEFIKANGERRDFEKWRLADRRLSQMSGELRDSKLKRVLNSGESTPEAVNRLLFSNQKSDVERLYRSLSPKGREFAQSALIKQAFDKSITDAAEGSISTTRFANELRKLSDQTGVFFGKEDQGRIDGLQSVLDLTRRASDAGVQTSTGQQLAVPAIATALGAIFGNFFSAVIAGASVGGIARAYESKPMRDFLIKLGTAKGKERARLEGIVERQIVPAIIASQNIEKSKKESK